MDKNSSQAKKRQGQQTQKPRRQGPKQVEIPENPTEEEREKLLARALFTCVWHLDRGDKTRQQLAEKLKAKAFTDEYIIPTLDHLEQSHLIDDQDYAERYTAERVENGHGFARISYELSRKGIPRELITETTEAFKANQPNLEEDNAYNFAVNKAKTYPIDLEPHKRMSRLVGALSRRGFREDVYSIAKRAIEEVASEDET